MASSTAAQRRIHQAALKLYAERDPAPVNIRELAEAAGVARGTIYNNLAEPEALFEELAASLAEDMAVRVNKGFSGIDDPVQRLAFGIRTYVRRTHEEPHWGRFLTRFAFGSAALQTLWQGPVARDVQEGVIQGRFRLRPEQLAAALGLIGGTTLSAMLLVLEGQRTWREAGIDAAELVLLALGLTADEARRLALAEPPPPPPRP